MRARRARWRPLTTLSVAAALVAAGMLAPVAQASTPATASASSSAAVLDPDAETPEVPLDWTTTDGSTPELVNEGPATEDNAQASNPLARVTGAGFRTFDGFVANSDYYTINLVGDARIEQLRPAVNAAAAEIMSKTGNVVTLTVGGGVQGSHNPAINEITLYLDDTHQSCGDSAWGKWIGCGGPWSLNRSDGTKVAVAGSVYFPTGILTYHDQVNVVTHELLHALGLHHYDEVYLGTKQLMAGGVIGVNGMQQGDINGVRYLASNRGLLGNFESASGAAKAIAVSGWAIDKNTTSPINVHVYVDGTPVKATTANRERPDLASFGLGTAHGFSTSVPATAGQHRVCVYAIAALAGTNRELGCSTVTVVSSKSPIGSVDLAASPAPGSLKVSGWTLDPDTKAAIQAHLYVDGVYVRGMTASETRNDVNTAYGMGAAHGYTFNVTGIAAGTHEVCVYGIDPQGGPHPKIACRSVSVKANSLPIGRIDSATSSGRMQGSVCSAGGACEGSDESTYETTISGWALDPDTSASITVHLYVDGKLHSQTTASSSRPDIATAYGLGAAHGYKFVISGSTQPDGPHEYCVWGIDSSGGPNPKLACARL